jgi:hypothetical protein
MRGDILFAGSLEKVLIHFVPVIAKQGTAAAPGGIQFIGQIAVINGHHEPGL